MHTQIDAQQLDCSRELTRLRLWTLRERDPEGLENKLHALGGLWSGEARLI